MRGHADMIGTDCFWYWLSGCLSPSPHKKQLIQISNWEFPEIDVTLESSTETCWWVS